MKSAVFDIMPINIRRSFRKLGADISLARRKRRLTKAMMAERLAVSNSTYARVEKGDPSVSMGIYAMTFFVLGLGDVFSSVVDPARDDHGLLLDEEHVPIRVRVRKEPVGR